MDGRLIDKTTSSRSRFSHSRCFVVRFLVILRLLSETFGSMPPFGAAHTFCTSRDCPRNSGYVSYGRYMFTCFVTLWKKQILARAIGTKKNIGDNGAFFRDNKASI